MKTENYNPIHHNQLVFHQNTFSKLFLASFFPLNLLFGFTFSIKSSKQDKWAATKSLFLLCPYILNKAGSFQIGKEKNYCIYLVLLNWKFGIPQWETKDQQNSLLFPSPKNHTYELKCRIPNGPNPIPSFKNLSFSF